MKPSGAIFRSFRRAPSSGSASCFRQRSLQLGACPVLNFRPALCLAASTAERSRELMGELKLSMSVGAWCSGAPREFARCLQVFIALSCAFVERLGFQPPFLRAGVGFACWVGNQEGSGSPPKGMLRLTRANLQPVLGVLAPMIDLQRCGVEGVLRYRVGSGLRFCRRWSVRWQA